MSDVATFVRARLSEWEQEILDGWDSDGRARVATMWTGGDPGYTTVASDHGEGEWVADGREVTDARHVRVLFDPARVLAQVAAIRAVLDAWPDTFGQWSAEQADAARAVKDMIRRKLAAIWSSHPDYDPAWAPEGE